MRESAICVVACVHIRLWGEHIKLCKKLVDDDKEKSQVMQCLHDAVSTDVMTRVIKKLELLAEFPRPESFHSAHFSRLLLGHTNVCVTLLVADQNYDVPFYFGWCLLHTFYCAYVKVDVAVGFETSC